MKKNNKNVFISRHYNANYAKWVCVCHHCNENIWRTIKMTLHEEVLFLIVEMQKYVAQIKGRPHEKCQNWWRTRRTIWTRRLVDLGEMREKKQRRRFYWWRRRTRRRRRKGCRDTKNNKNQKISKFRGD